MPFFDRSPPDCLQRLQFAFVLFKSRSCLFQELSVPCGSIALAGSYRYVNHPKTGFFGLAIFNLRCSFNFPFGSIPYRWNVLILTFSVLMQSNPTCFFFLFQVALRLTTSPVILSGTLKTVRQQDKPIHAWSLSKDPCHTWTKRIQFLVVIQFELFEALNNWIKW